MRCIGGPKHGRMMVIDPGCWHVQVPVPYRAGMTERHGDYFRSGPREAVYEIRPLSFGGTRIEVLVPSDYTESAAIRALADLIEDTPRYIGDLG